MKTFRTLSQEELVQCLEGIQHHAKSLLMKPAETHIILYGGEPLLPRTRGLVECTLSTALREGWRVSFITNGYTLTEYADLLSRYRKTVGRINVTLDGPETVHNKRRFLAKDRSKGTFRRIVRGIESVASKGIYLTINANLDPTNIASLKSFSAFVDRRSWAEKKNIKLLFSPVVGTPNKDMSRASTSTTKKLSVRHPDILEDVYEAQYGSKFAAQVGSLLGLDSSTRERAAPLTFGCADLKRYVLHVDGNIYPCLDLICIEKDSIGHWKPHWHISKRSLRRFEHTSPLHISKCRGCSMVAVCGGPCPARYHLQKHTPNGDWCGGTNTALAHIGDYLDNNEDSLRKRLSLLRKPAISLEIKD